MFDTFKSYIPYSATQLFTYQWWHKSINHAFTNEPHHVIVEAICISVILFLLIRQSYDPRKRDVNNIDKIPKHIQQELLDTWQPVPLVPSYHSNRQKHIVSSIADRIVYIDNKKYVNWASYNFLSLVQNNLVKDISKSAIDKYGVGSCGLLFVIVI